jgi:transposase
MESYSQPAIEPIKRANVGAMSWESGCVNARRRARSVDLVQLVTRKLTRLTMREFFSHIEPCLVGMEACGSAHYWARAQGHESRSAFDAARVHI